MTAPTHAGKTALVTGGTAGIGFHIAAALARLGMRVLVTGRDPDRAQAALTQLRLHAGHDDVHALLADGASIRENLRLAEEVKRRLGRLDLLLNNVGGGASAERRETPEGLEHGLALNFAGPFALTTRLVPLLSRSGGGRVVNVVSSAYAMWKRDPLADVQSLEHYVWLEAHGHAKLLSLLATLALSRRLASVGIAINAVNPGMAWTPGTAALTPAAVPQWRFIWPVVRWVQRRASAEKAARGPVFLASAPDATFSGRYFDGLREKRLSANLLDVSVQDAVFALGQSVVAGVASGTSSHR